MIYLKIFLYFGFYENHLQRKHRLCSLFHMPNITQLNLIYIIFNQRKLLAIFRRVLCEIQANQLSFLTFSSPKLANQSTLNKAHVIEVTKASKVAFIMEL